MPHKGDLAWKGHFMFDIFGAAIVASLMPRKKMSWDELAALCDRPSLLERALDVLVTLATLRARFRRAKGSPARCDMSESAAECRAPA